MSEPIPIRLHCPECHALHVDEGEWATKSHHTHSCQHCGMTWRPAVVHTVGVRFLPGFKNDHPKTWIHPIAKSMAWVEKNKLIYAGRYVALRGDDLIDCEWNHERLQARIAERPDVKEISIVQVPFTIRECSACGNPMIESDNGRCNTCAAKKEP